MQSNLPNTYSNDLRKGLLRFFALMLFVCNLPHATATEATASIRGTIAQGPKTAPTLKTDKKAYRLSSADPELDATLKDPRLKGRSLQLEGQFKGADDFEVQRLFVLRDGKRYRIIFYCDVCNLYEVKPGDCLCCQAPLELIEVPMNDPRGAGK